MRLSSLPEALSHDARYALRSFARTPAFTLAALFSLALGIGATTAVFTVVDRILFRSLPYAHEEQLVSFGFSAPIETNEFMLGADYLKWKAAQQPFAAMASVAPAAADCDITEANPQRVACAEFDSTLLPMLGMQPLLGRNFTTEEDQPNGPAAVLISYGLWRSRLGGESNVIGKMLSLDGKSVAIVGVLPRDFELPTLARFDIVRPLALDPARNRHPATGRVLRSFARLKPRVTAAQAQAQLEPLFQQSLNFIPLTFRKEVKVTVRSLRDRQVGDARLASWVLLGAVLAVLLIACTNVANLLLARVVERQREIAVRAALGASRMRMVLQALTESLILALAGGVVGCAIAYGLTRTFVRVAPQGIPRLRDATVDLRVLAFALLASICSGLLFGLARAAHKPSLEALSGGRAVHGSRGRFGYVLAAAQVAISVVLLSGAALMLHSLWNLQTEPLGMGTEHVIAATVALGQSRYATPEQRLNFYEQLEQRLRRLPGLEALAISDSLPPAGSMRSRIYAAIQVEGKPRFEEGTGNMVGWRAVTPDYFSALRIPIARGRSFDEEDRTPTQNSVILSESLARRLFGAEDPLRKRLRFGGPTENVPWFTIVGVARDVKNGGVNVPADPEYYVTRRHLPADATARSSILIRTPLNVQTMERWVSSEVAALDPTLPVDLQTMSQRVGQYLQRPRFTAVLLGIFAAMALLLAATGIYGVMAFLVSQRTQEIGVRMAVGATPRKIAALQLSHAARWTALGAAAGIAGTLAGSRLIQSLLFHVRPYDPLALTAAIAVLTVVALAAALVPARRAAAVDPMVALRHE